MYFLVVWIYYWKPLVVNIGRLINGLRRSVKVRTNAKDETLNLVLKSRYSND